MIDAHIANRLAETPFVPPPGLKNPHAQTIVSTLIPRRTKLLDQNNVARIFDVAPGVKVLARCSWQPEPRLRPTVVIVHGMEGSTESPYMLSTCEKVLASGFNAVRVNVRNCGGTEAMTPTLYHAGITADLSHIINELSEKDRLKEIYLIGFSLGGNIVLKLAGEFGKTHPAALAGVAAVSPSIDLHSCINAIELRSNMLYHLRFVMSLKTRMRRKAKLFPDRYDESLLHGIWSIRKFDETYTAPLCGFKDLNDYYQKAGALPLIKDIAVPTLIVHAKDDPFIPYYPLERPEVTSNSNVVVIAPDNGGHVGFVSAQAIGEDHFWAESKTIEFVRLLSERFP
ncbi:MAG TPA: alpha/beta fold hydrolase [Blastocatellia bacterium]|nr:alpha/beta fold hydrolase [Blastocatellia bacterium]